MAISGKKVVEEKAHAEARALAAEVAERDLRAAVEAIKRDFEVSMAWFGLRYAWEAGDAISHSRVAHISAQDAIF